jgi:hypothetical protein
MMGENDDEKIEKEGEEEKIEISINKYPSNSRIKREREILSTTTGNNDIQKKVSRVTTGNVIIKKKSLADRFAQTFFGDDTKSVGSYILYDVLVPAAKSAISDMITGGIEMLLYGESRSNRIRRDKDRSYVSYQSYYKGRDRDRDRDRDRERQEPTRNRARQRFDDIIVDTRKDAEEVLDNLLEIIQKYNVASVADFYDLVGLNGDWSDYKYGWDNLSQAQIARVREGYTFIFPRPIPLE